MEFCIIEQVTFLKTDFFGEDVCVRMRVCVHTGARARTLNMLGAGNCSSQGRHLQYLTYT